MASILKQTTNKTMNASELKQVATWWEEGKCEYQCGSNWDNVSVIFGFNIESLDDFTRYRRKPEPKLRPWKPEEVPVGAIVRSKLCTQPDASCEMVVHRDSFGAVRLGNGCGGYEWFRPRELLEKFQHSTDGGKTWKSCGVEE